MNDRGGRGQGHDALLDILGALIATSSGSPPVPGEGWARAFRGYAGRPGLEPISGALQKVLTGAAQPGGYETMLAALGEEEIGQETLSLAAATARADEISPAYAAFLLGWTALAVWILAARRHGIDLFEDEDRGQHRPRRGWFDLPAGCAEAALRAGGLYGARLLIEQAHYVLQINLRLSLGAHGPLLAPALRDYIALADTAKQMLEWAVSNMATSLREASGRARTLVGCLMWVLGFVPECHAFLAGREPAPRRLLRRLVYTSFEEVRFDPLLQFVWIDLIDTLHLERRDHPGLLSVFEYGWDQWWADRAWFDLGLSEPPSLLFVHALADLLEGNDEAESWREYWNDFGIYAAAMERGSGPFPRIGYIRHRLAALRYEIAIRHGGLRADATTERMALHLADRVAEVARDRARTAWHPERRDALLRASHASFAFIERVMKDAAPLDGYSEAERCALAFEEIEHFRVGALAYPMHVAPPLPPAKPEAEFAAMLAEEEALLEQLRGAYFMARLPYARVKWLSVIDDTAKAKAVRTDPATRTWFYSTKVAIDESSEIERELAALFERMRAHEPAQACARMTPNVDVARLQAVLSGHRRPG